MQKLLVTFCKDPCEESHALNSIAAAADHGAGAGARQSVGKLQHHPGGGCVLHSDANFAHDARLVNNPKAWQCRKVGGPGLSNMGETEHTRLS